MEKDEQLSILKQGLPYRPGRFTQLSLLHKTPIIRLQM